MNIHLVRDCLDKQVIDIDGRKIGRVDGIVIDPTGPGRPRVYEIEIGASTLARQLPWPFSSWFVAIIRRLSGSSDVVTTVPWKKIQIERNEVNVAIDGDKTAARGLEHWTRKHIVERIPGA
jgi:sporulation protein YlmC with PRC-barrel domain